ncbi:hypothetical protein NQ315_016123 [Exocentrus adspersus]|uniref:Uncharacterized protein n=1 Tax=Exocentrus adspersus TaxID=1586481 RepID=A0AAV8VC05_9CUCU|nr:hypothetical protein NQ315_016123 [Exocentrus adspersus]
MELATNSPFQDSPATGGRMPAETSDYQQVQNGGDSSTNTDAPRESVNGRSREEEEEFLATRYPPYVKGCTENIGRIAKTKRQHHIHHHEEHLVCLRERHMGQTGRHISIRLKVHKNDPENNKCEKSAEKEHSADPGLTSELLKKTKVLVEKKRFEVAQRPLTEASDLLGFPGSAGIALGSKMQLFLICSPLFATNQAYGNRRLKFIYCVRRRNHTLAHQRER